MGIRREVAVALAALGTLTAGATVAAATAWAAPPLHVEMSEVQCRSADLDFASAAPKTGADNADRGGNVATVRMTFRSATKDSQPVAYSVTVDGKQRASGSVSGGGKSTSGFSISNGKSSRLVVTSGSTVVLDRTVAGRC
jgi:hypothetical protein